MRTFWAAWVFYTCIPIGSRSLEFKGIARWVPIVGLGIGGLLLGSDWLLAWILPLEVRSAAVIGLWVMITGGLHLDGVADTADGLAVEVHQAGGLERRLAVMSDSRVGAAGVVAVVMVMLLKFAALSHLHIGREAFLLLTPAWGRWGQLLAIGLHPYLKAEGLGRFLKDSTRLPADLWLSGVCLGLVTGGVTLMGVPVLVWTLGSGVVAWGIGSGLARRLGGHTGDTYGAVVEWTEAILLGLATIHFSI